jgi:hypothetical protein
MLVPRARVVRCAPRPTPARSAAKHGVAGAAAGAGGQDGYAATGAARLPGEGESLWCVEAAALVSWLCRAPDPPAGEQNRPARVAARGPVRYNRS